MADRPPLDILGLLRALPPPYGKAENPFAPGGLLGAPRPTLAPEVLRRASCLLLATLAVPKGTVYDLIAAATYLDRGEREEPPGCGDCCATEGNGHEGAA